MKIRRELKVSPFGHQVLVQVRSAQQISAEKKAEELYTLFMEKHPKDVQVHGPIPEAIVKKRGQYRLNIQMQGEDVVGMITLIKAAMSQLKRSAKVIMTIKVD
jgi:primosomal protein N'